MHESRHIAFQKMKPLRTIGIILVVFAVFRIGVELLANYRLANSEEHQESLRRVEEAMYEIQSASDAAMRAQSPEVRRGIESVVKNHTE